MGLGFLVCAIDGISEFDAALLNPVENQSAL